MCIHYGPYSEYSYDGVSQDTPSYLSFLARVSMQVILRPHTHDRTCSLKLVRGLFSADRIPANICPPGLFPADKYSWDCFKTARWKMFGRLYRPTVHVRAPAVPRMRRMTSTHAWKHLSGRAAHVAAARSRPAYCLRADFCMVVCTFTIQKSPGIHVR